MPNPDTQRLILLVGEIVILVGFVGGVCLAWRWLRGSHDDLSMAREEWNFQHELLGPLRTVKGLMAALELGLEREGGLSPGQRSVIYSAIDQQIEVIEQLVRRRGPLGELNADPASDTLRIVLPDDRPEAAVARRG